MEESETLVKRRSNLSLASATLVERRSDPSLALERKSLALEESLGSQSAADWEEEPPSVSPGPLSSPGRGTWAGSSQPRVFLIFSAPVWAGLSGWGGRTRA